jgi:UDP-N-acetylmuramoyl-L-alanyl-D-glutamate--2,6-diaminopimelate ligase
MRCVPMNLLLDDLGVVESVGDPSSVLVRGVAHDSRDVVPGDVFCCVPGRGSDGHAHAAEAVERGAVGLLCEHVVPDLVGRGVVQVRVAAGTVRPAMARLAGAFFEHPSRDLVLLGVTGTNGKTTVTRMLGDLLSAAGRPTRVVGTLSGVRTTPEAPELQRILAEERDRQREDGRRHAVAMEVSSHALVQSRVEGIHFDVAVFTNLSHDHLDFHGTMEEYFEAKASLFEPGRALRAVIDADDPWGRRLLERVRIPATAVRRSATSDVEARPGSTAFTWRGQRVEMPLTGSVNVDNALLAAEAALVVEELGLTVEEIAHALTRVRPVPGRMEVIALPGPATGFTVLVDYAHTPAGLEVVLGEARRLATGGRVLCVFGCGGDRDRAKRPVMGAVAARSSDLAFVTSDNPRHEDPGAIVADVLAGIAGGARAEGVVVEPDRATAIERALRSARPADVVVVAGKGHETSQEIGDRRLPFEDAAEVRRVLADLVRRRPGRED